MQITLQCVSFLCLLTGSMYFWMLLLNAERTGMEPGKYPHFQGFNASKEDHTVDSAILTANYKTSNTVVTSEVITKHRDRISNINHWCKDEHIFTNWIYKHRNTRFCYSQNYNFNYCKVGKVGSTFWVQLFFVLETNDETKWEQFLNKPRYRIHLTHRMYTVPFTGLRRTGSRTILTSRDPYSRLYAVYIDKIFLPIQWKRAEKIKSMCTNSSTKTKKQKCGGKDVNFVEFLHYVINKIQDGRVVNRHLAPITALCKPCETDYFIHVKLESFADDIEYTLQSLNVSENKVRTLQDILHGHRAEYSLPGIIDSVMLKGRNARKCLTKRDIGARLWSTFQIQGYIDESLQFPMKNENRSSEFTAARLKDIILQTISASPLSSDQSKAQRRRALVNAYKTVDKATIQAIQEIYYPDFKLFGYPLEPPR